MGECERRVSPGATDARNANGALECVLGSGAYAGRRTDANGVFLDGDYRGEEVLTCDSNSLGFARFVTVPNATFSVEGVRVLRSLFDVGDVGTVGSDGFRSGAGTDVVGYCAASPRAGSIGINIIRPEVARPAILRLLREGPSILPEADRGNYDALVNALRTGYKNAYISDPIETTGEGIGKYLLTSLFSLLGLLGVTIAFGIGVPWFQKWFGPKPPSGPSGTSGGEGGGTPPPSGNAGNPNAAARNALPDVAQGILAFHGANSVLPGTNAPGSVPVVGTSGVRPGVLPVPVIPAPVAVPAPVVAPAPVVVPRLVPVVP